MKFSQQYPKSMFRYAYRDPSQPLSDLPCKLSLELSTLVVALSARGFRSVSENEQVMVGGISIFVASHLAPTCDQVSVGLAKSC